MPRINFEEPKQQKWLYVDPETSIVHLLVPLVAGGSVGIGTDNTCQAVVELQRFFGLSHTSGADRDSALDELTRYKAKLESDIAMIRGNSGFNEQLSNKQRRLEQINQYISMLEGLRDNPTLQCLRGAFPRYPEAFNVLMRRKDNLLSMSLCPGVTDDYTRSNANYVFTLNRAYGAEGLASVLRDRFRAPLTITPRRASGSAKDSLRAEFSRMPTPTAETLPAFIELLNNRLREVSGNLNIDVSMASAFPNTPNIDMEFLTDILCTIDDDSTSADFFDQIIASAVANEDAFWSSFPALAGVVSSPFSDIQPRGDTEKLSIMTQFYLGQVNLHCYANNISQADFGQAIERTAGFNQQIANIIITNLREGGNVEQALIDFINRNPIEFNLSRPITSEDSQQILTRFSNQYNTIKDSPHFDEFTVHFPESRGVFVNHGNNIAVDFADFFRAGNYTAATPDQQGLLDASSRNLANKTRNLPANNESIDASYQLDLDALLDGTVTPERIARILISNGVPDGAAAGASPQKVYTMLTDDQKRRLTSLPAWPTIRQFASQGCSNQRELELFNNFARTAVREEVFLLTPAMARNLYIGVLSRFGPGIAEEMNSRRQPDKILRAINLMALPSYINYQNVNIEMNDEIRRHYREVITRSNISFNGHSGYNVTARREIIAQIDRNQAAYANTLHLTQDMAISIYQEFVAHFPEREAELNALSNELMPTKILFALNALGLQIQNGAQEGLAQDANKIIFNDFNGYLVTANPEILRRISEIHDYRHYLRTQDRRVQHIAGQGPRRSGPPLEVHVPPPPMPIAPAGAVPVAAPARAVPVVSPNEAYILRVLTNDAIFVGRERGDWQPLPGLHGALELGIAGFDGSRALATRSYQVNLGTDGRLHVFNKTSSPYTPVTDSDDRNQVLRSIATRLQVHYPDVPGAAPAVLPPAEALPVAGPAGGPPLVNTYFGRVFGFDETNYSETQSRLAQMLRWDAEREVHYFDIPGKGRLDIGRFETPHVGELGLNVVGKIQYDPSLREQLNAGVSGCRNMAGNAMNICRNSATAGNVVQAASQPNALEMGHPGAIPEEGINIYENDHTQGPACALPALAGTALRNYFGHLRPGELTNPPNPGGRTLIQSGQTSQVGGPGQLNLFADAFRVLENWVVEQGRAEPGFTILRPNGYRNGYVYSEPARMQLLQGFFDDQARKRQFINELQIGIQRDTQITRADGTIDAHRLTQTYNSAISALGASYQDGVPIELWRPVANAVLAASYEASMLVQLQENIMLIRRGQSPKPILLTKVGGGVFGNSPLDIKNAICEAAQNIYNNTGCKLDIDIVHFDGHNPELHVAPPGLRDMNGYEDLPARLNQIFAGAPMAETGASAGGHPPPPPPPFGAGGPAGGHPPPPPHGAGGHSGGQLPGHVPVRRPREDNWLHGVDVRFTQDELELLHSGVVTSEDIMASRAAEAAFAATPPVPRPVVAGPAGDYAPLPGMTPAADAFRGRGQPGPAGSHASSPGGMPVRARFAYHSATSYTDSSDGTTNYFIKTNSREQAQAIANQLSERFNVVGGNGNAKYPGPHNIGWQSYGIILTGPNIQQISRRLGQRPPEPEQLQGFLEQALGLEQEQRPRPAGGR